MKAKKKYQEGGVFPIGRLAKEKKRARSIREGYAPTSANETHRMGLWEGADKFDGEGYVVAPTIRPVDNKGTYEPQSIDEAYERGEVFEFKNKRTAERFAAGSWKKGQARKEAMKAYIKEKRNNKK
jgi:hypothetical protein